MAKVDPIRLEVFKNLLSNVAEVMGSTLVRSSYSVNIRERRDCSCALFDSRGRMVAHAEHIPVHLGSMPLSVESAIKSCKFDKGDVVILNDPFCGGTHLPDITMVKPVFYNNRIRFFLASRAHHSDVGGISPASMPLSSEIFQEGIIIPPAKIVEKGVLNKVLIEFISQNSRNARERYGDIIAQIASLNTGEKKILELVKKYSLKEVLFYCDALISYSERVVKNTIKNIPDGIYEFCDFLDDDGFGNRKIKIAVKIMVKGDKIIFDFSKSSKQVSGCINATYAVTVSAVIYTLRCLVDLDIPMNYGCYKPVKVISPQGLITNAVFPSAVAGGNVETSQRIVDVIFGALSKAVPDKIPSASYGTMTNVCFGGWDADKNREFAYYETIAGGMGARADKDGESGVHMHMTNTANTPIEVLENLYPVRLTCYRLRKNSGGSGKFTGGEGVIREFEFLCDAHVTVLSDRRLIAPYGLYGGKAGKKGKNLLITKKGETVLPGKFDIKVQKGQRICFLTPGGGGHGRKQTP